MVMVDELDERLDGCSLGECLLGHSSRNRSGVSGETDNKGGSISAGLGTFIVTSDDDSFLASLSAGGKEDDSTCFETIIKK